ncbi:MAG TPA: SpoIID/LytB domain-containing protein [Bacteroidales bacterium]|nr:SpoIID/LytB domain-containing protein [Bacteroidales bacterium]
MTGTVKTPEISVGIVSGTGLTFTLAGMFTDGGGSMKLDGLWTAFYRDSKIFFQSDDHIAEAGTEITLVPEEPDKSHFTLHAVTIGINFHWQRNEDQSFKGKLKFIVENEKLTAVNILSIEDYLVSVISSEMSATSSAELLKAHAVISRSWLLAQTEKSKLLEKKTTEYRTSFVTDEEITRWYDREDHHNFDVCADDHCQRYQGITRASTSLVEKVISDTRGEVLVYGGAICDARYSKCCGGVTELFENAWEPVNHPYLQKIVDNAAAPSGFSLDLANEENAVKWIAGNPESFCNTNDKQTLRQVLNSYDQETNDFFRWKVIYSQNELSELVRDRTGIDFGNITDLVPLARGTSARIVRLKIKGSRKTMIIGKELEIRKALSKTHLYSSAFFVEKRGDARSVSFVLHGAGWGHGVGLCQIGAAVMGARSYTYGEILKHYFRNATLEKKY